MLVPGHREQPRPQRHLDREVERRARGIGQQRAQSLLVGLHDGQCDPRRVHGQHLLPCRSVHLGEDRPQALVPGHDIAQRRLQRIPVQVAGEPERDGDVVRGVRRLEAVEEPQAALRERQRHHLGPLDTGQRRARPLRPGQPVGESGHGGRLEQHPDRELRTQCRTDTADQTGGQQRVPAQLEEAVVDPDRRHPEELGEQPGEDLLLWRPGQPPDGRRPEVGCRKRLAVHLAVGRERDRVQHHERGRHHVLRHRGGHPLAQFARRRHRGAGSHRRVPHQTPVARPVLPHQGHRLGDVRVPGQRGLDLAEFDAVAAHLHLVVQPPQVVDVPVRRPPGQVARAVHPAARRAERVGDEALGGQPRPVEIAAGHPDARHVQLPRDADRRRTQGAVQYVHPGVPDRAADRHAARGHRVAGRDPVLHAAHRRLRGPVLVDHRGARPAPPPLIQHLAEQLLATDDDLSGRRELLGQGAEQRNVGRRHLEEGAPGARGATGVRLLLFQARHQHLTAGDQRGVRGRHRQVERDGGMQHGRAARAGVGVPREHQVRGQLAVLHQHALGAPRGTGRVDHVRRVRRSQRGRTVRVHRVGHRAGGQRGDRVRRVQDQPGRALGRGQLGTGRGVGQQQRGARVGEHVRDPLGRVVRLDRHVRGTGLQHRQQRHQQIGRARQRQRHEPLRTRAGGDQLVREPVDPRVELRVAEGGVPAHHRRGVRRPRHLGLEQFRHRTPVGVAGRGVPLLQHPPPLGRILHVHPPDREVEVVRQGLQHPQQAVGQPLGLLPCEQVGTVVDLELEPRTRDGHHVERVVVGVPALASDDAYPADRLLARLRVERIVLEHHQGVEEVTGTHEPLDLGQPQVLVRHQRALLPLDAPQGVEQRLRRVQPHPHRKGVDEQPDHALHAWYLRRAAGRGGAEHHVVAARQTAQQQRPRGLHNGVHGQPVRLRPLGEPRRQFLRQLRRHPLGQQRLPARVRGNQQRGLLHPAQRRPPGCLGRAPVLPGQPRQVGAIRRDRRQRRRVALSRVRLEQLGDQHRRGPAVQQDVVVGDDEPEPVSGQPHQPEPHQRRLGQVEPPRPVGGEQPLQLRRPRVLRKPAQIGLAPRQRHLTADQLNRLVHALMPEPGPQVGVTRQHGPRRRLQRRDVQRALQLEDQLHGVHVRRLLVVQGVKEDALLQRREGQDFLNS